MTVTPPGHARACGADIDEALQLAKNHLLAGRPQLTVLICQQYLIKTPRSADALHLLALADAMGGRAEEGIRLLEQAVALDGARADIRNDLGELLRSSGRLLEAIDCYRQAINLAPDYAEAHNNLGVALHQSGDLVGASAQYRRAIELDPTHASATYNLGVGLLDAGQAEDAVSFLKTAVSAIPDQPSIREKLAQALNTAGQVPEAIEQWQEVTRIQPDHFDAWYHLGGTLTRGGRADEARLANERAVALKPDHPWARLHLAESLEAADQLEEALAQLEIAQGLVPDNWGLLTRAALILRGLGRHQEALAAVSRALALKPHKPSVINTLGLVRMSLREWSAASAAFMAAAQLWPDKAIPMVNMACLKARQDDHLGQRHYFGLALAREPDNSLIRFSYSLTQIKLQEWAEAWRNYAFRPNQTQIAGSVLLTEPLPDDLTGKRLYIYMDQGLGDELLFLRFAPMLKARGAWIAYRPNPKLASFVSKLPFVDMAVGNRPPERVDHSLAVCDLALAVNMTRTEEIPAPVRLTPSVGAINQARRLLEPLGAGPFIGVTWRGGTSKEEFSKWNVLYKEIPLESLAESLRDIPGRVLILQRKPRAGEIDRFGRALGRPVFDFTELNEKLEVMLALLSLIDEYVAVSNTNVHIRAGAGRISRVLIPHPSDWRWGPTGASPWYPEIPTYRESPWDGWRPALDALRSDLSNQDGRSLA